MGELLIGASSVQTAFDSFEQSVVGAQTGRCGICMEEVIDRGVLDCCNHWFCFNCIDNWAVITNLCPLCKAQFEIITCVPVLDTISGTSEYSSSLEAIDRDEGWCINGRNGALSFPSYYIDEDAIVCLDGDGCRIRIGVTTEESSSYLDTSVACDSCDIWYHAICVGFDPERTIEGTWLCPRCKMSGMLENLTSTFSQSSLEKDQHCKSCDDMPLNSKMSVQVADAGETAVVVSMFESEKYGLTSKGKNVEVAPVEDESINQKSAPYTKTTSSNKHGGDETFQLAENGAYKDCTIFPSIDDSTLILVKDCSQMFSSAIPEKEVKHNSVIGQEGENFGSPTREISGEDSPVDKEWNIKKVVVPLCSDVNTNPTERGNNQPVLQSPESVVSADTLKTGIISPSIGNVTSKLVEEHSQIPSIAIASKEINNAVILPKHDMSNSAEEFMDNTHNILKASTGKTIEEREVTVGFINSQVVKSLEEPRACKGGKHSYLVDLPQTNYLSVSDDEGSQVDANCSTFNRDPIKSSRKTKQDPKCRDALAARNSLQFDQGLVKIPKQKENSTTRASPSGHNRQTDLPSPKTHLNTNEEAVPKSSFQLKKKLKAEKFENYTESEVVPPEILNIMKRPKIYTYSNKLEGHSSENTGNENNQVSSVRLKKIMPRRMDENETSYLVEEMRKELRAAVGYGDMENLGKIDAFDERLFEAFKAAMKKTLKNDNKCNASHVLLNQQSLKRGKIRENLTKKIYSTGSGKRRRAWDRDCEIEFWKARCNKEKQLKQADTPDSIRDLLKKSIGACSKSPETENKTKENDVDPIFSRLYLADNSLFPRKDDIKPLSAFANLGNLQAGSCDIGVKVEETNKFEIFRSTDNVSGSIYPNKECSDVQKSTSTCISGVRQQTVSEQNSGKCGDMKHDKVVETKFGNSKDVNLDKRKWALEVLARKTGVDEKKNEPSLGEKGSFPLLIQLPVDMRPILPHDRRTKVPTAVRQMQLNRLVEHYLKNTHIETIRRTAESELAVADAVNKEKEIYERSNSKSVYINLCAQLLSQKAYSYEIVNKDEACPKLETELSNEVTAALKAAGLVSDSPPGSPYHISEDSRVETNITAENEDVTTGSTKNVLELDSALDICQNFEHEWEAVRNSGSSSTTNNLRISNIQSEDAASKIKMVFSTGHWDNRSENEQADGHEKEMHDDMQDTGESKSLLSREELRSETNKDEVLTLDDMHVGSGSKGLEISGTQTNDYAVCLPDAGLDSKGQVPTLEIGFHDHFTHPVGSEDQSSFDKHNLNQREGQPNSDSCAVKGSVSDSILVSDRVSDALSSVKKPARGTTHNTKRSRPDENGTELIKTKKPKDTEMKQKCSVPLHPGGDDSKKSCEMLHDKQESEINHSIAKKVEAYVKEHIRPLCKSGIVTVEQYRWAVGKTAEKVMRYHCNAKNADFLIPEGNKVKKLAEQYLQSFKRKETC